MISHLDEAVPRWDFRERHAIHIDASPERVYAAIRSVTAREIALFRTLTAVRRLWRSGPESILNPREDEPILDVALRTGFFMLADDPPTEIAIAMHVIPPKRALAAMNFLVLEDEAGVRLRTETRIVTSDRQAWLRFALYWFLIRLGSGFIRHMWLRAIRKRAERTGGTTEKSDSSS